MSYFDEDLKKGDTLYLKTDGINAHVMTGKDFQYWLENTAPFTDDLTDYEIYEVKIDKKLQLAVTTKELTND